MAETVLFHHAHGLTAGVEELGGRLRAGGHTVHLPDLYQGHTFTTLEEGLDHARSTGFDVLGARADAAVEELGPGLVLVGLSLGGMPAQRLAQTRPGTRGAVLLHSCVPVTEFGGSWPEGVPVQVHGMTDDPFFTEEDGDLDAARALVASTPDAELFLYPGSEHLFTDSSLPGYDPAATDLVVERVLGLLDRIG